MPGPLSPSAQRIQNLLNDLGYPIHVVEFAASTRTAAEAAAVVGCEVGQIAKSIVFRTRETGRAVVVVTSGTNRVNEAAVARLLADKLNGERMVKADPEFVRLVTGFPIGGVPPVGHATPVLMVVDRDLLNYETVWAAAGTPNAVFPISPNALAAVTAGVVGDVT